jgi:hypothetical protein
MSACVTTTLDSRGLVKSATYVDGESPVTFTHSQTRSETQRATITAGGQELLVVDIDFTGLNDKGRFGVAKVNVRSRGVDWQLTLDGTEIMIPGPDSLPEKGQLAIEIRSGDERVKGSFDLATWKSSGLDRAPDLDGILDRDVSTAAKHFIPTSQAMLGYVARNSPVAISFRHRPIIFLDLGKRDCIVACYIFFAGAAAICATLGTGVVTAPLAILCALAALAALAICIRSCS